MQNTLEFAKALLQFIIFFGVVLALAWLTTRFWGMRTMGLSTKGSAMRVLQHIPAGRDRSLMLLEVGGRVYLLGITAEQINLLDTIDDVETIGRLVEMNSVPSTDVIEAVLPRSFREVLEKMRNRGASPAVEKEGAGAPASEERVERLQDQIARLRNLRKKP